MRVSFWTDKLSGKTPSNAQPLAAVQAWWTHESTPPQQEEEAVVPEPARQTRHDVRIAGSPRGTSEGSCPECDSGNYMAASPMVAARCFDCGYPLMQSTSGMAVSKNTPHGGPVRQVLGDGFHGDRIIGRGL